MPKENEKSYNCESSEFENCQKRVVHTKKKKKKNFGNLYTYITKISKKTK